MEISYRTAKIQKICESKRELQNEHGVDTAKKAIRRLVDLRDAATLEELRKSAGKCHELESDRKGQLAIEVSKGKRLIFEPDPPVPIGKNSPKLNWNEVTAIKIIEITDYH